MNSRDISVVVQGPVVHDSSKRYALPLTFVALRALRQLLPDAQIIVSTWEGSNVRYLDSYDELVLSKDPGTQGAGPNRVPSNINRQLVSTRAGLEKAIRPYVLKIRSDMVLQNVDFIRNFEEAPLPSIPYGVFSRKIVCNNLSSRNPHIECPGAFLFHPADHAHFGLAEDIRKLWSAQLQTDVDASWFEHHPRPDPVRQLEVSRFTPEQHLLRGALLETGRCPEIEQFADYATRDPHLLELSEGILGSNFFFVPDGVFSLYFPKYDQLEQARFEIMRRCSLPSLDPRYLAFSLPNRLKRTLFFGVRLLRKLRKIQRRLFGHHATPA